MISSRTFSRAFVLALTCGALLLPAPVLASTASSNLVLVRDTDVVHEDLYASGNQIIIRGVIEGDLVASAFESVVVEGKVEGDIVAIAGIVDIRGEVGGSVRVVADRISVSGIVGGDVVGTARTISISGSVANDVLVLTGTSTISGSVGRDARMVTLQGVTVSGHVERDLESNGPLTVSDGASVGGDVRYRGEGRLGDVEVGGTAIALGDPPTPVRIQALALVGSVLGVLSLLAFGFFALWLAPRTSEHALRGGRVRSWVWSFAVGLMALVIPLMVYGAVLAGAGAVSPDLVGAAALLGVPILVGWFGVLAITFSIGLVPVAVALGGTRRSAFARYLIGVILVSLVLTVLAVVTAPQWAALTWLTLSVVGTGAWLRGAWAARGSLAWVGRTVATGT